MVQLIALVLFLFATPAWSTTYYVSTSGNNSNNGTSESTPYLTIQKCGDVMVAGDTCLIRGGTYAASGVRLRNSGSSGAPITLKNYPNETPTLSCTANTVESNSILISHITGIRNPIGWLIVDGIEVTNCYDGVKWYNLHDSQFTHMHIHDNKNQGFLGIGGARVSITKNRIYTNGPHATSPNDIFSHGIYINGTDLTIQGNIFYNNTGFGIQMDGTKSFSVGGFYASDEFAGSNRWIISDNTFAYSKNRSGIVIWGGRNDDSRIENNIFYENGVSQSNSTANAIECVSATGSTGILLRNNHSYASGSGGLQFTNGSCPTFTSSGNVTNVSAPAFVNGGSNSLPASPDFRLTASAPVNIAGSFGVLNNSTNVVGAFKTLANPVLSMTANKITGTYPLNTAGPIQNLSTTGVTVGCTGSACPGSPTVASVTKVAGTDSQFEVVVNGITGNACEAANQTWTLSYNSSTGSWTANDNIGTAPGLHQKMFSFTNLAVTNACTGSGPPAEPGTPYIKYLFDEGTGTTATNTGSLGAPGNGTLQNGVTWADGGGVTMTPQSTQYVAVPYLDGVNPSTQDLTIAFTAVVSAGNEGLPRTYGGTGLGTNQRFYISTLDGTWRIGIQTSNDATASNLAVDVGPQHICLVVNSTTGVATLHKNGVASVSAGAVKSLTSYLLTGNFELGRLGGVANGPGGTFRDFVIYQSVEDCATIYQSTQVTPSDPPGVFSQTAVQFEDIFLPSTGGSPRILNAPNNTKKVVQNGALVVVAQIECDDCEETAFRLESRDNGVGDWLQVPLTQTSANTYMWGQGGQEFLNSGVRTTRVIENGCTVVQGTTQLTASQIPSLTLPASGCTILGYLIRVQSEASGYTEFRIVKEGGVEFAGTYVLGRITITPPQATGVGF